MILSKHKLGVQIIIDYLSLVIIVYVHAKRINPDSGNIKLIDSFN